MPESSAEFSDSPSSSFCFVKVFSDVTLRTNSDGGWQLEHWPVVSRCWFTAPSTSRCTRPRTLCCFWSWRPWRHSIDAWMKPAEFSVVVSSVGAVHTRSQPKPSRQSLRLRRCLKLRLHDQGMWHERPARKSTREMRG